MTAGGTVLDDDSLLSRLERAFLRLEKAMGIVAGIGVICLMLFAGVTQYRPQTEHDS